MNCPKCNGKGINVCRFCNGRGTVMLCIGGPLNATFANVPDTADMLGRNGFAIYKAHDLSMKPPGEDFKRLRALVYCELTGAEAREQAWNALQRAIFKREMGLDDGNDFQKIEEWKRVPDATSDSPAMGDDI